MKVTPLNQLRESQIFRLFSCQNSCTGNAGTGIEILCFCSAHPLIWTNFVDWVKALSYKVKVLNDWVRCAFGIFQFSRCLTLPSLGSRMQNPRLGDAGNKLFMSLSILDSLLWNEYFARNSTEPNFYLVRFMRPEAIEAWVGVKGGEEVECAQVSCFVLSCISYVSFICNPSPPPPLPPNPPLPHPKEEKKKSISWLAGGPMWMLCSAI